MSLILSAFVAILGNFQEFDVDNLNVVEKLIEETAISKELMDRVNDQSNPPDKNNLLGLFLHAPISDDFHFGEHSPDPSFLFNTFREVTRHGGYSPFVGLTEDDIQNLRITNSSVSGELKQTIPVSKLTKLNVNIAFTIERIEETWHVTEIQLKRSGVRIVRTNKGDWSLEEWKKVTAGR